MQANANLTLEKSTGFECDNCGGIFFKQSMLVRRWSKLLIGTPTDHVDVVPVFRCEDCNEVLKDFFPRGMKDVESKLGLADPEEVSSSNNSKAKLINIGV